MTCEIGLIRALCVLIEIVGPPAGGRPGAGRTARGGGARHGTARDDTKRHGSTGGTGHGMTRSGIDGMGWRPCLFKVVLDLVFYIDFTLNLTRMLKQATF